MQEAIDIKGNKLQVGDEVAYVDNSYICIGTLKKFCGGTVRFRTHIGPWKGTRLIHYDNMPKKALLIKRDELQTKEIKKNDTVKEEFLL